MHQARGVVHALRKIRHALVPGGLVIDTQPLTAHPPIESASGTLDMSEWARTIATIDGRARQAIDLGPFDLERESSYIVTDEYETGPRPAAPGRQAASAAGALIRRRRRRA